MEDCITVLVNRSRELLLGHMREKREKQGRTAKGIDSPPWSPSDQERLVAELRRYHALRTRQQADAGEGEYAAPTVTVIRDADVSSQSSFWPAEFGGEG